VQVAGLTEETETVLVDLVERAAELAHVLSERGIAAKLDGNRLTLPQVSGDDYDVLRDAIVETGALLYRLAPERHSLASVFDAPSEAAADVSTSGRAEIFDLGYQGYDGERTSRWRRRRAIWRDGVRISLGLGRGIVGKVAPWVLIALALAPARCWSCSPRSWARSRRTPMTSSCPRMPSTTSSRSSRWLSSPPSSRRCSSVPTGKDGVLSLYAARPITPTDYVASRWLGFFTVAATVATIPEAVLFVWNLLDAHDTGSWIRDNWDVVPRFLASGLAVSVVLTTLALFVASFTNRRAYAAIGTVAVLFIGGAVGGIAHDNFDGTLSKALSEADVLRSLIDTVHWLFGDEIEPTYAPGWVSALWLAGLTVVLAVWLLRRTERMVRG
jgi:ABC-2 type transport system permease protein